MVPHTWSASRPLHLCGTAVNHATYGQWSLAHTAHRCLLGATRKLCVPTGKPNGSAADVMAAAGSPVVATVRDRCSSSRTYLPLEMPTRLAISLRAPHNIRIAWLLKLTCSDTALIWPPTNAISVPNCPCASNISSCLLPRPCIRSIKSAARASSSVRTDSMPAQS